MKWYALILLSVLSFMLYSCASSKRSGKVNVLTPTSTQPENTASRAGTKTPANTAGTGAMRSMERPLDINRQEFVNYAKTFLGTPYKYGSADPEKGVDCSGLLYFIFQHYRVKSPRSSYDYENMGREVSVKKALPGDIILFTGENSRKIGHMGIVTENKDLLKFIHAPGSGTVVTIGRLSGYFEKHFVKVIRVLK